jgi:uncharacterized membrane protein YhaH (DUF805 family)
MDWYMKVIRNYAGFSGRARRKEFWMFVLFNFLFAIGALILDNVLGLTMKPMPYGAIYLLYTLAVLLPSLAVAVRRLHDLGKSGWMLFISLIPVAGAIWLLVLYLTDGTRGTNKYGPDPKEAPVTA